MSVQVARKILQFSIKRYSAPFAVSQNKYYSDVRKDSLPLVKVENLDQKEIKDDSNEIALYESDNITAVSGIPKEHIKGRLARIYLTPKNAMQSGTDNANCWEMEFDTRERWENPLMGWSSSGDPLSNIKLQFFSQEDAIRFAKKNGYDYYIEFERKEKPKVKSYGHNFSWNKRSRVSTK